MSDHYTKISSIPVSLYADGSPVMIESGDFLKGEKNELIACLIIRNLDDRTIRSATVVIRVLDNKGIPSGNAIVYEYKDLNANEGDTFGAGNYIVLPSAETTGFVSKVEHIEFSDSSTWDNDSIWLPIPDSVPIGLATPKLDKDTPHVHIPSDNQGFYPQEFDSIWQCDCGTWNKGVKCYKCSRKKNILFPDSDILDSAIDEQSMLITNLELETENDSENVSYAESTGTIEPESGREEIEERASDGSFSSDTDVQDKTQPEKELASNEAEDTPTQKKSKLPFRVHNKWCIFAGLFFIVHAIVIASRGPVPSRIYCPFAVSIDHDIFIDFLLGGYALCWFLLAIGIACNYPSFSKVVSVILFVLSLIIPVVHYIPKYSAVYNYYASQVANASSSILGSYGWAAIQIQDILIAVQLYLMMRSFSLPAESARNYTYVMMALVVVSVVFRGLCWMTVQAIMPLAESAAVVLAGYFCVSRYYASNINIE